MSATRRVRSSDGTSIALEEAGDPRSPPVVLIHGIAQSREVWRSALQGPLAGRLRLVAFELRGHGESAAPAQGEDYAAGDRLGSDLRAVIEALALERPIVVASSYGGVVVGEYLRRFGAEGLGGLLLVAAAILVGRAARALYGPTMLEHGRALTSGDHAIYEAGARAFAAGWTAAPLDDARLEALIRPMLAVPAHVRKALLSRGEDYSPELERCPRPIATLHGLCDSVVLPAMSRHIARQVQRGGRQVEQIELPDTGHLPWIEAPAAFEAALLALVDRR